MKQSGEDDILTILYVFLAPILKSYIVRKVPLV